jgi:hypothetical protein
MECLQIISPNQKTSFLETNRRHLRESKICKKISIKLFSQGNALNNINLPISSEKTVNPPITHNLNLEIQLDFVRHFQICKSITYNSFFGL